MYMIGIFLLYIAGALGLLIGIGFLYFLLSPMPVVRLLRRGFADELSLPCEYEQIRQKVKVERDIVYASQYGRNTMDLYLPGTVGAHPLVLWVHGGAFVAGDKCGVENWGVMLAGEGYAVAAMNYEWAPEAAYPAQVMQITDVVRCLGAIAEEKGLDLQRVIIAGDSAGAHMAAQYALLHTNQLYAEQVGIHSPLEEKALRGALLYCGPYDLQAMLKVKKHMLRIFISRIGWSYAGCRNWQSSPLAATLTIKNHVDSSYVPCYITDGNAGSFEGQGRALGETLRQHGVEVVERYFASDVCGPVNHEYQMKLETENGMLCFADTIAFLKKHLK